MDPFYQTVLVCSYNRAEGAWTFPGVIRESQRKWCCLAPTPMPGRSPRAGDCEHEPPSPAVPDCVVHDEYELEDVAEAAAEDDWYYYETAAAYGFYAEDDEDDS